MNDPLEEMVDPLETPLPILLTTILTKHMLSEIINPLSTMFQLWINQVVGFYYQNV